ncbi:MAG TPA: hypothetical protein VJN94_06825 [Candidatus Binataceae bacterium]|nr:hypothetical protein [Candidatus Binataceae bacterium]
MILKVALALAVGSLCLMVLSHRSESQDEVGLEREVEARLQTLREHLFRR